MRSLDGNSALHKSVSWFSFWKLKVRIFESIAFWPPLYSGIERWFGGKKRKNGVKRKMLLFSTWSFSVVFPVVSSLYFSFFFSDSN